MKIDVVTTFSSEGYQCYGRHFIESFLEHEKEQQLFCYHESLPSVGEIAPNLTWRNLDNDIDRREFIAQAQLAPERLGDANHPNWQSVRFCHKVFALTDAALHSTADWLVWMDADIVVTAQPDWAATLRTDADLVFLGRPQYAYTECGFVGYRLTTHAVREILADMRRYYTTGEIWKRPRNDWHDSRCFDICRERSGVPRDRQVSLSKPLPTTHVWPHTVLGRWCEHHKGPARKQRAYGGVVS